MTIGQICNREVVVVKGEASVAEAARIMREHHVGDVVVIEETFGERRPVGLVTDRDVVVEVVAEGLDAEAVTVADIMTRRVETLEADASFLDALARMRASAVRRMPVVDRAGVLQGIFTLDDALALIGESVSDLVKIVDRGVEQERKARPARSRGRLTPR